jgi:hypothetical protein
MINKISCRVSNWLMKPLWYIFTKMTNIPNLEQEIYNKVWEKEYDFLTKDAKQILDNLYQERNGKISYLDLCHIHIVLSKGLRKAKKEATNTVFEHYAEIIKKNKDVDKRNN